ncbi:hypothetical protein [Heyndrickxia ginsengihumi]|uniref:hypothetical protein n=1 Tax=Heyndrickxia ginsengihumi TaxID=363870 RepID=UPI003D23B1F4
MELEQRLTELEKRVTDLEKKAAAVTTANPKHPFGDSENGYIKTVKSVESI